jgi:hypothetical protein
MVGTTVRQAGNSSLLLAILDEAYNRRTWSDMNVRKSLRGITAAGAAWRPPHARHNIAQIVLHLAYWKTIVCGRLDRERKRAFPLEGSDWFETPARLTEAQWDGYIKLLADAHRRFRQVAASVDLSPASEAGRDRASRVYGLAMHDMYHAGQIAMIRAQHGRANGG